MTTAPRLSVALTWTETLRHRAWVAGPYRVVRAAGGVYHAYWKEEAGGGGALVFIATAATPDAAKRRCRTHAERPR
jgi:hypothetical protein